MSLSFWLDSSKKQEIKTDIAIIGGGISGTSIAYWLNQRDPSTDITIIDRGCLAAGATGRNAGFITCGSVEHFSRQAHSLGEKTAHELWKFSEENLALLKENIIDSPNELGFEQKGSFSLASTASELKELEETAALMERLNISVESIHEKEILERLCAKDFKGGVKYLNDASIDPVKLNHKILEKSKARFLENSEVLKVEKSNQQTKIFSQKYHVTADVVVLALNGYSASLFDYFSDKIFPTKGQILITKPAPAFLEAPCYANFVLDYFRQLPSGELLIGGFRQLEKETEVGYSEHTTPKIQQALEQFVKKHFPVANEFPVTHRWGGIMGFSRDGLPLIGSLPDQPNIFFVGGYTGHGIGLSFNCAKHLVNLMFGDPIFEVMSAKRF